MLLNLGVRKSHLALQAHIYIMYIVVVTMKINTFADDAAKGKHVNRKRIGLMTDPWGTPNFTFEDSEDVLL